MSSPEVLDEIITDEKRVTFNLEPHSTPSTPPSDAGKMLQISNFNESKETLNKPPLPPTLSDLIGKYDNLSDISEDSPDSGLKIIVCEDCKEKYESASGLTTKCPECREKEDKKERDDDTDSEEGFKIICANPNCREEYISASGTTKLCPDCR